MAHNDEFDELKVHNEPDEPEDVIRQMEIDSLENTLEGWADDPHGNESHSDVYLTADDINGDETVNTAPSPHNNDHHAEPYATQESVDSLQTDIDGTADDPHDNTAHSENYATSPHGDGSHTEDYAVDGDAQPPEAHDNTAHSEDYATESSLAGVQTDVDGKADDPHDNTAHSENYAIDGDAQPPESHDNTAHSEDYAINGDPQPPEGHDNSAHTEAYATEADVAGKADAQGSSIGDETPLDSLHTDEATFVGELPAGRTGLGYDEWSSSLDTWGSGTTGPRIKSQIEGEVRITGATVDVESSGDTEVALKEINSDDTHGSTVDTSPISVTPGRNEVDIDIVVPDTGEEYVLTVPDSNTINFGHILDDSVEIPYPIEGDLLTLINNSHPDGFASPAGNYSKFFDIETEAAETPEATVSYQNGISELGYEGVTIVETGQELYEEAHDARAGTHVRLKSGNEFIVPDEIYVNEDVIIDGNHATIKPSGDHNIFFLEDRTTLKDIRINASELEYTSDAILCDTDRYGDGYHGSGKAIELRAVISGNSDVRQGCGFRVNVGSSAWFSVQQDISLKIGGMGSAIRFDVNGPHANGNRIEAHLWGNRVNLHKTGSGNFASRFIGEMDGTSTGADSGTEYLLLNEGPDEARASTFYGFLWDKFHASEATIEGKWHIVAQNRVHTDLPGDIDNAAGVFQWFENGELGWFDLEYENAWRFRWANNRMEFSCDPDGQRNFSDWMQYRPDSDQMRVLAEIVANDLWVTGGGINLGGGAEIRKNSDGSIAIEDENGNTLSTN